jgi:hypothetical protein
MTSVVIREKVKSQASFVVGRVTKPSKHQSIARMFKSSKPSVLRPKVWRSGWGNVLQNNIQPTGVTGLWAERRKSPETASVRSQCPWRISVQRW